jgi:hypothetical protein
LSLVQCLQEKKTKQNTPLVSSCRYVCPEPVLANVWVLAENGANEPVFLTGVFEAAEEIRGHHQAHDLPRASYTRSVVAAVFNLLISVS